jgi:Mor family transcriptional regulator
MNVPDTDLWDEATCWGGGAPTLPEAACALSGAPERWPRRMAEMIDLVLDELERTGLLALPQERRQVAARVVTRLCHEYGGAQEYWPKTDRIARALRDAAIWADHDGTTRGPRGIHALARQYGITSVQVWAIMRAQRALHRRRRDAEAADG